MADVQVHQVPGLTPSLPANLPFPVHETATLPFRWRKQPKPPSPLPQPPSPPPVIFEPPVWVQSFADLTARGPDLAAMGRHKRVVVLMEPHEYAHLHALTDIIADPRLADVTFYLVDRRAL